MIRIPGHVDQRLLDLADTIAGPDTTLIDAMGWERRDYVNAIYRRLRAKWREGAVAV